MNQITQSRLMFGTKYLLERYVELAPLELGEFREVAIGQRDDVADLLRRQLDAGDVEVQ